jgi:hypothetical protein
MGFFGNLFSSKSNAYKKFESLFGKIVQKQISNRSNDQRDAFLTPDLLNRRNKLANDTPFSEQGAKRLILDFGTKGEKRSYSLAKLQGMALAGERIKKKYNAATNGAKVGQLIAASDEKDINCVKNGEIKTSALYKIHGNLLHFQVSASPQSNYTHHQVKVRLEEWDSQLDGLEADKTYLQAAKGAATGRVSFTCDCGRHRYWYRYLATTGHFALDPLEGVFPKIRNPHLSGCCCKHVIKTLAVLLSPLIQMRLSKEMENQAKKKGFITRMVRKATGQTGPDETFLNTDDMAASATAGTDANVAELQTEFKRYISAMKGIKTKMDNKAKAKMDTPTTQETVKALKVEKNTYRSQAKKLKAEKDKLERDRVAAEAEKTRMRQESERDLVAANAENARLRRDVMVAQMSTEVTLSVYRDNMSKTAAVAKFAASRNIPIKEATEMAKQVNI